MVTLDLIWASQNRGGQKSSPKDNRSIFWITKLASNNFLFFENKRNIPFWFFFTFACLFWSRDGPEAYSRGILWSFRPFVLTWSPRPSNFGPERSNNVLFRVPERCWAVQLGSKNGWCSFSAWMQLIFILQFYYNPSSFYLAL